MEVNLASHEPPKQFTSLRSPWLILSSDEVKLEKKRHPLPEKNYFFWNLRPLDIRGHQTSGMAMMSKQMHFPFSERLKNIHHVGFNMIIYCGLHEGQPGL